jgi:hypothetical protein
MKLPRPRGVAASFAVVAAAIVFAAAAGPAAAWGHKKAPPPPPPPPVEQEVAVGPPVLASYALQQASAYATYMRTASAIPASFASGDAVTAALHLGVHGQDQQLQQGMVAYAAVVALQDPTFTATVREFAKLPSHRDVLIRNILTDPDYVLQLNGHDTAAGLIMAALNAQGSALKAAGEAVRQASYDIQLKASWSKKPVPDPDMQLQDAKTLSSSPLDPAADLRAELTQASAGAQSMGLSATPQEGPYSPSVVRAMALAALAILGKAGDEDIAYVQALMANGADAYCFNMAKLNLYQCLSVARPYYEDMFCLGQHGMADKGSCVIASAGPVKAALPLSASAVTAALPAVAQVGDPPAGPPQEAR